MPWPEGLVEQGTACSPGMRTGWPPHPGRRTGHALHRPHSCQRAQPPTKAPLPCPSYLGAPPLRGHVLPCKVRAPWTRWRMGQARAASPGLQQHPGQEGGVVSAYNE